MSGIPNTDSDYWAQWVKGVTNPHTLYIGWENSHGEKVLTRADGKVPVAAYTLYANWFRRADSREEAEDRWNARNRAVPKWLRDENGDIDTSLLMQDDLMIGPSAEDCEPPKVVHFCWPPSEKNPNPVELVVDDPALAEALVENGRPWSAAQVRQGDQILYSYNEDLHDLALSDATAVHVANRLHEVATTGKPVHFGGEELNAAVKAIMDLHDQVTDLQNQLMVARVASIRSSS